MSNIVKRKSTPIEDKEKKPTESPVKDMKKKMAANAEKEKQVTDKITDKHADKPKQADKTHDKPKQDKPAEKAVEKKVEKIAEKPKQTTTTAEKSNDKSKDKPNEKQAPGASDKKVEKNGVEKKGDAKEKKDEKVEKNGKPEPKKNGSTDKPKQNGSKLNGDANGEEASDDDVIEIADDEFPELAYDESDTDVPTPDGVPSRSATRRSQSKESKLLKLNEAPTDRKLRSADSPKPEAKNDEKENGEKELEVIIEVDVEVSRKPDTNFSKSRVKVSPYRRSGRLADQTTSSVMANYTGNNTTMEMDITESSLISEEGLDSSAYLSGLRGIRGRRSYKLLGDMPVLNRSARASHNASVLESTRPTGTVVGRKRKPELDDSVELGIEPEAFLTTTSHKRMRLLDRLAAPFRRTVPATIVPASRTAEIVGINTDLPLTAPVSSDTFDPEQLKAGPSDPIPATLTTPLTTPVVAQDKRCVVM